MNAARRVPRTFWPLLAVMALMNATVVWTAPVTNSLRPWTDYRTIMWVGDSAWKQPDKIPLFLQRLREMGISTAMVHHDGDPQPFVENAFPYYVENLVNKGLCLKWNSNVRDWDRFVTDWAKGGRPESALIREYCLDGVAWRSFARDEVQRIVRRNREHAPLAYDLRDELSTTVSANPFDYDFSPAALRAFREWLKARYRPETNAPLTRPSGPLSPSEGEREEVGARGSDQATLAALNAQWETQFKTWDDVKPFTTDQIKNRMASGDALPRGNPDWQAVQRLKFDPLEARKQPTRWNFSPWCDFRSYMDLSLAGALNDLRQATRAVDPHTPVGIEGTQMPHAFGGYDLWRLSQALDWVEPYDVGNAREIFGSFMPGQPILTTVFERDTAPAMRRLWHLLLEGDRGCIIWWSEDCLDWKSPDYALTPKAKALAPVLKEMTSPLAQLFLRAERESDPIAIHYSQPSIQVDWLLESTVDGSTWLRRFSSYEADHNRMAKARNAWLKAFQDLGYSPRFLSSAQIEAGDLVNGAPLVLVLPTSLALSGKETGEIARFLTREGIREPVFQDGRRTINHTVFCDGSPGLFDEHGRLRPTGALETRFPPAASAQRSYAAHSGNRRSEKDGDLAAHARQRLSDSPDLAWANWIREQCPQLTPAVRVPLESRTRIHRFRVGLARLIAFERNIDYHMSEDLKQAGGNEALEKPIDLEATLASPAHIYDLRSGGYLGRVGTLRFRLDPWQPSLFALLPEKAPGTNVVESIGR